MAKLEFDKLEDRRYENGVSNLALFVSDNTSWYKPGVAWNGITKFNEQPEGGNITPIYADNIKFLALTGAENMKFTLECITYPNEWKKCDGRKSAQAGVYFSQQQRESFAVAYLTNVGTEANPNAGRKLHLVYGCKSTPSERSYETINNDPAAMTFSYSGECTPVATGVEGYKPTSLVEIDEIEVTTEKFKKILDYVYGTESTDARMPKPADVIKLVKGEQVA